MAVGLEQPQQPQHFDDDIRLPYDPTQPISINLFSHLTPTRAGSCHVAPPRRRHDAIRRTIHQLQQRPRRREQGWTSWIEFVERVLEWFNGNMERLLRRLDAEYFSRLFYPHWNLSPDTSQEYDSQEIDVEVKGVQHHQQQLQDDHGWIRAPEIDPYESWWNGKVSLFDFFVFLVRDYLYDSSNVSDSSVIGINLSEQEPVGDLLPDETLLKTSRDPWKNSIGNNDDLSDYKKDSSETNAQLPSVMFEFRILKNPAKQLNEGLIEGKSSSATFSIVTTTDSPALTLIIFFIFLHYIYLLISAPSSSHSQMRYVRRRERSPSPESVHSKPPPTTHIYLHHSSNVDIDEDDLTCSEAEDEFGPMPAPMGRRNPPLIPPLLQRDSMGSTDGEEGVDLAIIAPTNVLGQNVSTYLKSPTSPSRVPFVPGGGDRPQSLLNDDEKFSDISVCDSENLNVCIADDTNFFICFVTQITDPDSYPYNEDLDDSHHEWLTNMLSDGVVLAYALYEGENSYSQKDNKEGVMIMKAKDYETAQDVAMGDPYHQHCICTFRIVPWNRSSFTRDPFLSV